MEQAASDAVRAAIANQAEHFDMLGLQLGFIYESGAIADDSDEKPAHGSSVRDYVPTAFPGARVPHAWVTRAGVRVSTLDLFAYDRFTLVVGPAGQAWAEGTAAGPVPIDCLTIGRTSPIRTGTGSSCWESTRTGRSWCGPINTSHGAHTAALPTRQERSLARSTASSRAERTEHN